MQKPCPKIPFVLDNIAFTYPRLNPQIANKMPNLYMNFIQTSALRVFAVVEANGIIKKVCKKRAFFGDKNKLV